MSKQEEVLSARLDMLGLAISAVTHSNRAATMSVTQALRHLAVAVLHTLKEEPLQALEELKAATDALGSADRALSQAGEIVDRL